MAKLDIYNLSGAVTGSIELSDSVFGITPNENAIAIVVRNQLANLRQGTQSTKTRSEVRGGGKSGMVQGSAVINRENAEKFVKEVVTKEQAKEYGHSILREYAFLIAHSMLHLCGYDHMTDEERVIMENAQNEILNELSIISLGSPSPIFLPFSSNTTLSQYLLILLKS